MIIKCQHQNSIKSSFRMAKKSCLQFISTQHTANIENRIIGEGRLIYGIVDICCRNNTGGYLVAMGIEKAFGSSLVKVLAKALSPGSSYY